VFRDHTNPLDVYNDDEMYKRYRFSRDGIRFICDLIGEDIRRPTMRSNALLPVHAVCIALQYFATGTFQMVVGDAIRVEQSAACRAIHAVSAALTRRMPQFIRFPTNESSDDIKQGFYALRRFPGTEPKKVK